MARRTTVIPDDDVYELLVKEAVRRYGSVRALSRVISEVLRKGLREDENEVVELICSEKRASTSEKEFEEFMREMSRRFEER